MAGYRRERETRSQKLSRPKVVLQSRDAISRAWRAFDSEEDPWFAALLKFLLLTGQRRTETALATWENLDLIAEDPVWSIPADVRKMGDAHKVPLGSVSRSILADLPRHSSNLVFPGRRGAPMSGWTQRLSNIRQTLGEPSFAFHALRRTYRTGLSELGVPFELAELMIGHARPDLSRRYDFANLWRQRRDAQDLWEQHVTEVVGLEP
jgi:integrase